MQDNYPALALTPSIAARQSDPTELPIQIVRHIMDHLHSDLSASALAKRFSLEQKVLSSAFERHTGLAVEQFVLRRRVERALHLLKHSKGSDSEIAVEVGWETAGFRAAFASYLGVSVTEYRTSLLHAKQSTTAKKNSRRPCQPALIRRRESTGEALRTFAV